MKAKTKARWVIKLNEKVNLCVDCDCDVCKDQVLIKWNTKKIKSFSDLSLQKLGPEVWEKINKDSKGRILSKGELIYQSGTFIKHKVESPIDGLFLGIDEFGNLKIELTEESEGEIKSPINGRVSKKDEDKLVLEFEALEFLGKGLVEGKVWGRSNFKLIKKASELNFKYNGQIILADDLNQVLLSKAEVLGVAAILTDKQNIEIEKFKTDLPIVVLERNDWEEILSLEDVEREILVNSKTGRVLVVVE
jgi:hypothetical protein